MSGTKSRLPAKPDEQPEVRTETVVADIADERRSRKDAIQSENSGRGAKPERAAQPRRDERSDRPRRDDKSDRSRRQHNEDNDGTVGFGEDMPAFMRNRRQGLRAGSELDLISQCQS